MCILFSFFANRKSMLAADHRTGAVLYDDHTDELTSFPPARPGMQSDDSNRKEGRLCREVHFAAYYSCQRYERYFKQTISRQSERNSIMKCLNCGEREATYQCSCLKVDRRVSISTVLNQRETRERAVGIEKVGICDKCQKKLIRKNRTSLAPLKIYLIPVLLLVLGIIISMAGFYNSANGGGSETMQIAGLVIALPPCFFFVIIYDSLVLPAKLKKTPYKVFGHIGVDVTSTYKEGQYDIYVPLGENFYKDEKDFGRVNQYLSEDIRKQIYEKLVVADQWKQAGGISAMGDGNTSGQGNNLLEDSVKQLIKLYWQHPQGFLTSQADEVRAIGSRLNEAGGMEMMLAAHTLFRSVNPGMARNLEMVWDGIGNWRG